MSASVSSVSKTPNAALLDRVAELAKTTEQVLVVAGNAAERELFRKGLRRRVESSHAHRVTVLSPLQVAKAERGAAVVVSALFHELATQRDALWLDALCEASGSSGVHALSDTAKG